MEFVKWRKHDDHQSLAAWVSAAQINIEYEFIETVGHLVKENQDLLVIAMSKEAQDGEFEKVVTIPKNAIEIRKTFTFEQLP